MSALRAQDAASRDAPKLLRSLRERVRALLQQRSGSVPGVDRSTPLEHDMTVSSTAWDGGRR